MSVVVLLPPECVTDCPTITQIPGPSGTVGTDGADGINGSNAYGYTTANFAMPSVGSSVDVTVTENRFVAYGVTVFVEGAGYFSVANYSHATPDSITIVNLGTTGNATAGTVIANPAKVVVTGPAGTGTGTGGGIELG